MYIYICIHTHTHTYIYIYIHIYIWASHLNEKIFLQVAQFSLQPFMMQLFQQTQSFWIQKRSNKKKKGKGWKDYLYMYHIYVHVCIYIYKYKILKEEIHSFKIFQSPIFSPSKNCSRHNWGPQGPFSFFLLHPSGPHTWMSHVTHINESCHTYEWPISHTWEPVCPLNRVRLIYEWVMSHM